MSNTTVNVVKSLNTELKQATYVVMVPDEVDAHGDITSEQEVLKACHNFNVNVLHKSLGGANMCHLEGTSLFSIVESYCTPTDFVLDDKLVKKGTWLQVLQTHSDELWQLQKSGQFNGLSIGAWAKTEELGED